MTQLLFQDAHLNCGASVMEKYSLEKNIPFKILLIIDNSPRHPPFIGDLHPNIKVAFLPPNTSSLIQPMAHGAIAVLKAASYLSRTFAQAALQLRRRWCNSRRITAAVTAPGTLLRLGVMSPGADEWPVEEDLERICPSCGGCRTPQGCG